MASTDALGINLAVGADQINVATAITDAFSKLDAMFDKATDTVSATAVTLPAEAYVHITGTNTITSFASKNAGIRVWIRFAGILILTHNATSLILPTGANITTAANDTACLESEGSGNWRCVHYLRADGTPLAIGADTIDGTKIADDAIDSEHYTDGSIDEAHLANDAVALSKLKAGTDGQIITYDASGDPVAVGPGTDGQVLTSTGAGSPPAFEAVAAGGYTPVMKATDFAGLAGNAGGGGFSTANDAAYMPIDIHGAMTITKISLYIATSSGNIDVGIYNAAGTKLVSLGSTASPGTGMQTLTVASTVLAAGQHFIALAADNTTFKWGVLTAAAVFATGMMQIEAADFALPASFTPGAWPTGVTIAATPPIMGVS